MAKRAKSRRAENLGDFAGPDADRENIEKLAAAAKKANANGGGNSQPSDEAIQRNADAIEVALIEVDTALRVVQKARADLGVARKTAKTDLGSKGWVDSVVAAVKLKRQAEKGGTGEIVTEHRQMGRVLRLLKTPLGFQFNLFNVPGDEDVGSAPGPAMDAELQGQHAFSNREDRENNPFTQGTDDYVAWDTGFVNAMNASIRKMGPNGDAAAH